VLVLRAHRRPHVRAASTVVHRRTHVRTPGRVVVATAAAAVAATTLVAGAPAATAVPLSHPRPVGQVPTTNTPHVLGTSRVEGVAQVGGTTVLGGVFTEVASPDRSVTYPRTNLVAFDTATGAVRTDVAFDFNNEVLDVVPAGDGTSVFVAGTFTFVDGARHGRIVKINIQTGQIDPTFRSPGFDNRITTVELNNGILYVGGAFTTAAGQARSMLATLDPVSGALTDKVNVTFTEIFSGTTVRVNDFAVTPDGSRMVVAGNFRKVNDTARDQIAVLDLTGPTATLSAWATTAFSSPCNTKFEGYIKDLDVSGDGSWFVAVTTGSYRAIPSLCDTASRFELTPAGPGQQPTWVNYVAGDTLTEVTVADPVVYVGGHHRWVNGPYRGDAWGPGAVEREGLSAHDARNGMAYSWNPGRARGVGVYDFLATEQGLWVGSDTDRIGNWNIRDKIAFLPFDPTLPALPADRTGTLPGEIVSLNSAGATAYGATTTAIISERVVDAASWDTARGATMIDDTVYYGSSDGRLLARTFDGDAFGPAQEIDLLGLTDTSSAVRNLPGDLQNLGAMFLDRGSGRLYYTVAGSNTLYYRYFLTETRHVGAQRFTAATGTSPVPWGSVRGAFLTRDAGQSWLYYAHTDGTLRRIAWDGTTVTGSPQPVSGPAVDGRTWNTRALFVSTVGTAPSNQLPTAMFTVECTALSCVFDGSDSRDPDGTITSYEWDFGDGTTASGAQQPKTYASAGTRTVRLTVTDDRGGTATTTQEVAVSAPNQAPTAAFTVACTGLTCAFDASGSRDPDGTVTAYGWDFGNGTTGSGRQPTATYAAAGTYTVTLTVTDAAGAAASTTQQVSVSAPTAGVAFRAATKAAAQGTAVSVTVPGAVQTGDVLLLMVTGNQNSGTRALVAPAGWASLGVRDDQTMQTRVWWRRATAADAGSTVRLTSANGGLKWNVQVLAYSGVTGTPSAVSAAEAKWTGSHVTPTTTAPVNAWAVQYWADKSNTTTTWTVPSGTRLRLLNADDRTSGRVSSVSADLGPVAAGTVGGLTAVSNGPNGKATMWTVVLPR
jgi:PKD repeat protein